MSTTIYWLDKHNFSEMTKRLRPQEKFSDVELSDKGIPNWCFFWDADGPKIIFSEGKDEARDDFDEYILRTITNDYHRKRFYQFMGR